MLESFIHAKPVEQYFYPPKKDEGILKTHRPKTPTNSHFIIIYHENAEGAEAL